MWLIARISLRLFFFFFLVEILCLSYIGFMRVGSSCERAQGVLRTIAWPSCNEVVDAKYTQGKLNQVQAQHACMAVTSRMHACV